MDCIEEYLKRLSAEDFGRLMAVIEIPDVLTGYRKMTIEELTIYLMAEDCRRIKCELNP
jgi:hypothetical protein